MPMKAPDTKELSTSASPVTAEELAQLPQQLQVTLAARCALRVLPFVIGELDRWKDDAARNVKLLAASTYWAVIYSIENEKYNYHSAVETLSRVATITATKISATAVAAAASVPSSLTSTNAL